MVTIEVPSSKSIANRALVLAALTKGKTMLRGDFRAEDIQLMIKALRKLGIEIQDRPDGVFIQNALSWQQRTDPIQIFVGNSGTCMRFLASLVALRSGETILKGIPRMHERPIRDLVEALRQLGVHVQYLRKHGYPPIRVGGRIVRNVRLVKSRKILIKGNVSSQFVSSLLLVGAALPQGLIVQIDGELISKPYVDMTIRVLERFGVSVKKWGRLSALSFQLPNSKFQIPNSNFFIEGDASAAVYWWAFGIMHKVQVTVTNVPRNSIQPDAKFPSVAKTLWYGKRQTFDMSEMPDASLMLMAMAAVGPKPVIITGIGSLRVKECDRIQAMVTELQRIGAKVKTDKNWIKIWPIAIATNKPVLIKAYHDHRIAMSFAILNTKIKILDIQNPVCVKKSYPKFWEELSKTKTFLLTPDT